MQLLCLVFLLIRFSATESIAQRDSWKPKEGELVECRSLTVWVQARYVETWSNGMPICELNGVRRPFHKVRKLDQQKLLDAQKLADTKREDQYDKHAVREPPGHTSHVNPLKPNTDRSWFTEARWLKGQEYEYQNGPITDDPAFRAPPLRPQVKRVDNMAAYGLSIGITLMVILLFICTLGAWFFGCQKTEPTPRLR